jgi:hypothetical protein
MKVVLLRVGIDTGFGGIHGPLFKDGSFEYIPIPDGFQIDRRTYGNTVGRKGKPLLHYFPPSRQARVKEQSIHVDPEFTTFTYGDPTRPKAGLRHLEKGDILVFYCGLQGWDFQSEPALYLMGYFEILAAGKAKDFSKQERQSLFGDNFHIRHKSIYAQQEASLVLIKGTEKSRLFNKAELLSELGIDRAGRPLKVISSEMQTILGSFGGKISFQRSPPRWVEASYTDQAANFVRSLE